VSGDRSPLGEADSEIAREAEEFENMAWVTLAYDRAAVNAASKVLFKAYSEDGDDWDWNEYSKAWEIITNWRSAHSFPLNTLQNGLRAKAKLITSDFLVAQRIKRLSSIEAKLERFPSMKLSQMQDIGGCRAIMPSVAEVTELVRLYKKGNGRHRLASEDDYISAPRASGYRGVHFIYGYYSDRNDKYNSLKIEIQIRSALQHAWATAVETVGTFTQQALKSSIGEAE
jgi:ppGpp synthetase/RelA/SpoT-type nucleotidyltranferase